MVTNGGIVYIDQATTAIAVTDATGTLRRSIGGTADTSERAAWSPDGSRIAVGAQIVNPDGSGAVRLPFAVHHPTWSPDGRRIAFIGQIQESIGTPDRHRDYGTLLTAPVDNSAAPTPVSGRSFLGYPAWTPDGTSLAYSRDTVGATATEIVRHHLTSGRQEVIVPRQPGLPEVTMAAWSPDGLRLVFALINSQPDPAGILGQIVVIDGDGTGMRVVVTSREHRLIYPCWSPDGQLLAYTQIHSLQDETHTFSTAILLVVPAAGGTPTQIAAGTGPSWAAARDAVITVHAAPDPVVAAQTVTLAATAATGGTDPRVNGRGSITFRIDDTPVGTAPIPVAPPAPDAFATLTVTAPPPGPHTVTATYPGDGEINPGAGTTTFTSSKPRPTIAFTAHPSPAVVGTPVTLHATVRGPSVPPTGTVRFFAGLTEVGDATITGGNAQITTTALTDGLNQPVYGIYEGDPNNLDAVSTIAHLDVQVPTRTTITADPPQAVYGQPVHLTVAVARAPRAPTGASPAGVVDVIDDTTVIATGTLTAGQTQVTADPAVGTRGLRAVYRGQGVTAASRSDLLAYTVTPTATTTTVTLTAPDTKPPLRPPQPPTRPVTVPAGQPVRLNPTLTAVPPSTATPGGRINYTDHLETTTVDPSTVDLGTVAYDPHRAKTATGQLTITLDQPGRHRIVASYQGDDRFAPSHGEVRATVTEPVTPVPTPEPDT